jgi:hypothetical protein
MTKNNAEGTGGGIGSARATSCGSDAPRVGISVRAYDRWLAPCRIQCPARTFPASVSAEGDGGRSSHEKIENPLDDPALLFALKYRVRVGKGLAEGARIRVRLLRGLPRQWLPRQGYGWRLGACTLPGALAPKGDLSCLSSWDGRRFLGVCSAAARGGLRQADRASGRCDGRGRFWKYWRTVLCRPYSTSRPAT